VERTRGRCAVKAGDIAAAAGITSGANLLLALEEKKPYDSKCCVRVSSGEVASAVRAGAFIDTYCGLTLLVPRIFSRCTPGGLCMSAVN